MGESVGESMGLTWRFCSWWLDRSLPVFSLLYSAIFQCFDVLSLFSQSYTNTQEWALVEMCLLIERLNFSGAWIQGHTHKICAKILTFVEIMKLERKMENCSKCLDLSASNWFFWKLWRFSINVDSEIIAFVCPLFKWRFFARFFDLAKNFNHLWK